VVAGLGRVPGAHFNVADLTELHTLLKQGPPASGFRGTGGPS
jgi:hypothetical protein